MWGWHIIMGPLKPNLQKYPSTKHGMQNRRFQFSLWEFYIIKGSILFSMLYFFMTSPKNDAFIVDGFENWEDAGCEKTCLFAQHEEGHCSFHNDAMSKWNLKDLSKNVNKRMNAKCSQQVLENR